MKSSIRTLQNNKKIKPFLKWAGGKRWFIRSYYNYFPNNYNNYIEPFLGSGAVYFFFQPNKAILSDINCDLIDTYRSLKNDWLSVWEELNEHQKYHNKSYYYKVRDNIPKSLTSKASRLIYLNRTCWNGLYRVNLNGRFNVPIGTKNTVIFPDDNFHMISNLLKKVTLYSEDFEYIISLANKGDFIYIDPPYTVRHNNNSFIKYNEKIFRWKDQLRLRDSLIDADSKGVYFLLSNADCESIKYLYWDHFEVIQISRHSVIAANSSNRRLTTELIIRNFQ